MRWIQGQNRDYTPFEPAIIIHNNAECNVCLFCKIFLVYLCILPNYIPWNAFPFTELTFRILTSSLQAQILTGSLQAWTGHLYTPHQ